MTSTISILTHNKQATSQTDIALCLTYCSRPLPHDATGVTLSHMQHICVDGCVCVSVSVCLIVCRYSCLMSRACEIKVLLQQLISFTLPAVLQGMRAMKKIKKAVRAPAMKAMKAMKATNAMKSMKSMKGKEILNCICICCWGCCWGCRCCWGC